MFDNVKEKLSKNAEMIERALAAYYDKSDADYGQLIDSQRYSLLGGGKRIRAYLVMETCRTLGGEDKAALPYACAIEMVHTYSLIHDDLPCMDNDVERRGKPTNHVVYGEATALLAGDALLTMAFEAVCKCDGLSAENKVKAVKLLSEKAGACGMIGGQQLDLNGEKEQLSRDTHLKMNLLKTGALIRAAALLGCIAADADEKAFKAADEYAKNLGLAFQVTDDLLDDGEEDEKTTFLTFMSREEAQDYADGLTEKAVAALGEMENTETLISLAYFLAKREV